MKLDNIEKIIIPKIEEEGFEIEYVEFVKEGDNNILRVVIDNPNGNVAIDDCEKISRKIEDDIDKNIDKEYVLEVSSAGLERQLKNIKLFEKYIGSEVYVKLYKKLDDKKAKCWSRPKPTKKLATPRLKIWNGVPSAGVPSAAAEAPATHRAMTASRLSSTMAP